MHRENGFTRMTLSGPRLQAAGKSIDGYDCVYGLGSLTQVSDTQVAVALNRRPSGVAVVDYEDGVDFRIFDSIEGLAMAPPQPAFRNERGAHPVTGQPLILTKYPGSGGFVPLGARRRDGSVHPHAGTGFALSLVIGYPASHDELRPERKAGAHNHWELTQLRFDGRNLHVGRVEVLSPADLLPGETELFRQSIQGAVPDGDDLLLPVSAGHPGDAPGAGISRWRRGKEGWRPLDFIPVTPPDLSFEPSLLRDVDGSLLLAVRGFGRWGALKERLREDVPETWDALRLYRSTDGAHWREAFCLNGHRAVSPIVLNVTADGQPYLAGNPMRRVHWDRQGLHCNAAWMREDLFLWPLNEDRTGVGMPMNVFDGRRELGMARTTPDGINFWYLDHPIGGAFRLADGHWHSLLGFRVCDMLEVQTAAGPTKSTGYWLEEMTPTRSDPVQPRWSFSQEGSPSS